MFEDVASKIERLRIRSATEVEKFSALLTKAHDIYGEWVEERRSKEAVNVNNNKIE